MIAKIWREDGPDGERIPGSTCCVWRQRFGIFGGLLQLPRRLAIPPAVARQGFRCQRRSRVATPVWLLTQRKWIPFM